MSKPLRVLHVISGLHLGGAETLLYRLATTGTPDITHEVICLGDRQWYSARLEEHGVPVHHLGITSTSFVAGLLEIRRLVRASDADVVQSWLYVANVLTGIWARAAGLPVVWGIHASTLEHVSRLSRLCAKVGGRASPRLADFVINCSSCSAQLHEHLGYGAVPNAVIHNGYDPEAFFPDVEARRALRHQFGIQDETFLIGSVARWHAQKDIPNLLRATRLLRERGLPVMCLLAGAGLDQSNAELANEISVAGCAEAVILAGAQSNVRDYFRAMDLHVLASSGSEAFPNVVAESMLCGTPNVVTDVGDAAFMVEGTGWVTPPRNSQRLARAMREAFAEWSDDRSRWEQRRTAARKRIADRFTFDRMVQAYEDVWRRVAAKS